MKGFETEAPEGALAVATATQYRPVLKGFETMDMGFLLTKLWTTTQYRPVLKGFETSSEGGFDDVTDTTQYRPVLKGFETPGAMLCSSQGHMLRSTAPF